MKRIYLLLGGESKEKERSNKLFESIYARLSQEPFEEILVICSGFSGFNLNVNIPESSKMKQYLIEKGIPKERILEEDKSLDTLGNILYSYFIIEQLILNNQDNKINLEIYPNITISLVTSTFHLGRSKELFLRIFKTLKGINPNVNFEFIPTKKYSLLKFWKYTNLNEIAKDLFVEFDSQILYNLRLPEDYLKYLNSLPIYSQRELNTKESIIGAYSKAIKVFKKIK